MYDEALKWATGKVYLPMDRSNRAAVNQGLQQWFAATNKKPLPNLEYLVTKYRVKLAALSETIKFFYDNGVLKSEAGTNQKTLDEIKFGATWFEACAHFETRMLAMMQD